MPEIPAPGSISFADRVTKSKPCDCGFGSTPRTATLRDSLFWKAAMVKDWTNIALGLAKCEFRQGVRVDVDRARLVTQAYKEAEAKPPAIRRAHAVERMCDGMPIFIKPGELIVGDANGAPDEVRWHPEWGAEWMPEAVTTGGFSNMVTEKERKEIVEDICEYWKDRSAVAQIRANLPKTVSAYAQGMAITNACMCTIWEMTNVLPAYEYEKLYAEGLAKRIEGIEEKLKDLETKALDMHPAEYIEKRTNWEAMILCGKAIIRYAERHAHLARELAKKEKDRARKRELKGLAEILEWVPANPPRNFHEALQFFWIVETVGHFMTVGGLACGVRADQVLWPYYEADMKADRITRGKALELVECLFIKIQELGMPLVWPVLFVPMSGASIFYGVNICGSTPDGQDASNDLSCIMIEALANTRLSQPPLALRYHHNISPDVVERAIDLDRVGDGHPSWINEDLLEKWGLIRGWPADVARNTQLAGCVANHVKGKCGGISGVEGVGNMILPMVLEDALYQGNPPIRPPRDIGVPRPNTKDPRVMKSSDELLDAVLEWTHWYSRISIASWNTALQVLEDCLPDPCNSFLLDDPMERGIDGVKIAKEQDTMPFIYPMGQQNLADSLAAIQKLVFDDRKYTMEELLTALKANWAGQEEMRQDFLNAPKYGNDDDYADQWMVKVKVGIDKTFRSIQDAWGHPLIPDGSTAAGYQMVGFGCGATPDGRRAMSYLADGSRSPMTGADKSGPTAALNSAGKIPFLHTDLFNMRVMPQFLEKDDKLLFAEYLREWYEKGNIFHIQFNVIDSRTLQEAQEHPQEYQDLQVRVAGYSAFWVDLPKETQDSIIARTEHCFS